jgi:hypothetical protein
MKLATTPRILAVLLASGLALGTGLYACGDRAPTSSAGANAAAGDLDVSADAQAVARPTKVRTRAFRIGLHRGYALRTTTTTDLGNGQRITIAVTGALDVAYADATSRGERFRFVIKSPKLGGGADGAFDAERAQSVEAELALPFFVTIDHEGHVSELLVPRGATSLVSGLRKHVATLLQYETRNEKTWETAENDTTGVYHARYASQGADLVRTKDRYTQVLTAKGLVAANVQVKETIAGRAAVTLDEELWPAAIHVNERSVTDAGAGMNAIVSTRRDDLELTARGDDRAALGSALREGAGYETVSLESLELFVAQQHNADVNMLKGRSLATLLTGVEAPEDQAAVESMAALEAYLRLNPEAASGLTARMRKYDLGAKRIFGALAAAGTPESQEALTEILRDRKASADAREDAAISLSMAEKPTRESLEALRATMGDKDPQVASVATLGAGNLARKLSETDADVSDDVVATLLRRLDAASDTGEIVLVLRALGNAGDERVLPYATRFLASRVEVVRAATCDALTFVKSPAADDLLVRAMLRDDADDVRVSAIRVSGMRPFDAYAPALALAATKDESAHVRLTVVERLGLAIADARAVTTLTTMASSDADADVRGAASALIASVAKR